MFTSRFSLMRMYAFPLILLLPLTNGCTSQERADAQVAIQEALSALTQNRALTEQFVRDVKATKDVTNPAYMQALYSYQNAAEVYNRFLDEVESGDKTPHTRSLRGRTFVDVQNATADFMADATAVLKPGLNTRRVQFQRAIIVPGDLASGMRRLPKRARERIIDELDGQVRWRSWQDL